MHCWDTRGPLPLDEQEIAGLANCRSSDEVEALRYILSRYFERMEDGFYNQRVAKEIERAQALSIKRKYAGSLGYQAKAKQMQSKSQAIAPTHTHTLSKKSSSVIRPVDNFPPASESWAEHWTAQGKAFGINAKAGESTGDYCKRVISLIKAKSV